jgi:hypothetical protein
MRYHTCGEDITRARYIWFVGHGYGQLASSFILHFAALDPQAQVVIAPQGLHRFYLEGRGGCLGALGMTREARQDDTLLRAKPRYAGSGPLGVPTAPPTQAPWCRASRRAWLPCVAGWRSVECGPPAPYSGSAVHHPTGLRGRPKARIHRGAVPRFAPRPLPAAYLPDGLHPCIFVSPTDLCQKSRCTYKESCLPRYRSEEQVACQRKHFQPAGTLDGRSSNTGVPSTAMSIVEPTRLLKITFASLYFPNPRPTHPQE